MARYQHLPVYQASYVLVREVYKLKVNLPKNVKYELGSELSKSSLKIIKGVVLANGSQGTYRVKILKILCLEMEVLWTYFRLLFDLKCISKGEFKIFLNAWQMLGNS